MTSPKRVVSLVPSITETLFELGAGDVVVAITDFCIFPPNLALPRVGGTKSPRVEEIRALAPDLVHMNHEENLRRHDEAIEAECDQPRSERLADEHRRKRLVVLGHPSTTVYRLT